MAYLVAIMNEGFRQQEIGAPDEWKFGDVILIGRPPYGWS